LPNWTLRFHKKSTDGSAKCNIVPSDQSVYFAIFDIDAKEKQLLDRVEGLNYGYEEIVVIIPEYGECFSYVASESHIDESLMPYSWYKELVLAGLEYHQVPLGYVESVRAIAHQADVDTRRRETNMALVSRFKNGLISTSKRAHGYV
jgi:hypothetical protein